MIHARIVVSNRLRVDKYCMHQIHVLVMETRLGLSAGLEHTHITEQCHYASVD